MLNDTQHTQGIRKSAVGEFAQFIQIVGRGQRTGATLTQAQAHRAMQLLLEQHIRPEQEGAFLMLLRVREETVDEIVGFTQACRDTCISAYQTLDIDLDISAYAGKRRQLPWFMLAIATLAQSGVRIMLHSSEEPHSKRYYAKQFLSELGLSSCENPLQARAQLAQSNFCFVDLADLHPKLHRLIQLREVFGLRSCANTLARLLNPSKADYSLQGVHHRHVDYRHMHVSQQLGDANTLCFRGDGGEPEINPSSDTLLCINRAGKSHELNMPASTKWALKEQVFNATHAIELFNGTKTHDYGEKAVLATLSSMLILLKAVKQGHAYDMATALWSRRNKTQLFI